MNSNGPDTIVAETWPKLEPAFPNPPAYEAHGKLPPSTTYPKGQVLGYHAASGQWRAGGGAGVGPRRRLLTYQQTTDASGYATKGPTSLARDKAESVTMMTSGCFFVKDLTGITSDADVDELGRRNGMPYDNPLCTVTLGSGA
jgi:hypothetical protein